MFNEINDLKEISKKDLDDLLSHSEACLVDAYSRMKMGNQNWTKHTDSEVDFIEKYIVSKESRILDLGCGIGRHTAELYKRGYKDISAVDFQKIISKLQNKLILKLVSYFLFRMCEL